MRKETRLNLFVSCIVAVVVYVFSYSGVYALESSVDSSSILLASDKKSVYNTSRGDVLSNLNTSYYDGVTANIYLDEELSVGYLMGIDPNVFMHFGIIFPFDTPSKEFGLGFIVDAAYSFGFTSFYELQTGGGFILWYASEGVTDTSLFRLYFSPKISNVFHVTNNLAFSVDLLFSAKLYASEDYSYVKRTGLDLGMGVIYKL